MFIQDDFSWSLRPYSLEWTIFFTLEGGVDNADRGNSEVLHDTFLPEILLFLRIHPPFIVWSQQTERPRGISLPWEIKTFVAFVRRDDLLFTSYFGLLDGVESKSAPI
jgi:hypothetical protein